MSPPPDPQLSAQDVAQLQQLQGGNLPSLGPSAAGTQWMQATGAIPPSYTQQAQQAGKQKTRDTQKQAAQKIEDAKQQLNTLLSGAGMNYAQFSDPKQMQPLAVKIATLLGQLPVADAQKIISSNPMLKGTSLGTAVTTLASQPGGPGAAQAAAKPAAPYYDPLALQTMWHDVFGPAYAQASKIGASAAPSYQTAMTQALAGAHQSPQATQMMKAQTDATTALLQQFAGNQAQSVPAGLSFDSLIGALGTASAKAQLAQGAYERQAQYQGAAPFLGGTSSTGGTAGGAAALLAPIIANTAATPPTAANPLGNVP